jgi:hypothetical protein
MQPQIQQIPQPQIIVQNSQIPMNNVYPQNQVQQLVQVQDPNFCEKCSEFLTGSTNIPVGVFTLLMLSLLYHICCSLFYYGFLSSYYMMQSFFDFIFALFIWSRMAIKIERSTSTVKYFHLCIINLLIICLCTLTFPLGRIWNFILFETILISLKNKNKSIKFFCCKITGKNLIIFTILYHVLFNILNILSITFTIGYAFIYNKWLIQKLNISNEKVQRIELNCLINFFKNKLKTFVSIQDVLKQEINNNNQHMVQGVNNNISNNVISVNNSNVSFVPNNTYPNYYSGIAQNSSDRNQNVQYPPNAQPVVDVNQAP